MSSEGVSQGASTACSVIFLFLIEVIDPCFIPRYDPVHKIKPSSGNLWHAKDISQNCLNWTKSYTHFPRNALHVSASVAHDYIVHSFGSFIVGGLFWPPTPLIISDALPANLKFSRTHFFTLL
jgi:hypothetical protein